MHFPKPYCHIPSRLMRGLNQNLQRRLKEKQSQLHKASSWEDMQQRGSAYLGGRVRKFHHDPYRILAVVEPEWHCMWIYNIYHKDDERKINRALWEQIQRAREEWGIEGELKQAYENQRKALEKARRKPPLPDEYREWLRFPDKFFTEHSYLILESWAWYEAVTPKSLDWLKIVHYLLKELLAHIRNKTATEGVYPEDAPGSLQIHYQWFSVQLPEHSKETWVLYLNGVSSESGEDFEKVPPTWEEAAKRARRAYPAMVLENEDLWLTTVKGLPVREGIAATLALSEEEMRIFASPSPRPLFINGRAGSGKTTLLYWLFAEYLIQAWDWKKGTGKPFRVRFLTYSERLRDAARDQVHAILKVHPMAKILREEGTLTPGAEEKILENIMTFREFLLKELHNLSAPEAQKFNRENYIDFPRFRDEYLKSPIHRSLKRRFSPEQAWFALRALILGYDADAEMDPDWYAEAFGRKDEKVFSKEDFQTLYQEVYLKWYRKRQEDQGWWNEVDLARKFVRLLRHHQEQLPDDFGFHLLVVDEAQDFTRVEFQLLFRLLYWSRFALTKEDWERIPLILAGDPLQTINPTGFRWGYVKTIFNNALSELDIPYLRLKVKSLKKNYRSARFLVCLSNAVLFWRQNLFGERGEKGELFQEAWYAQKRPSRPTVYPFDQEVFAKAISDRNFVVIGPWFSGQDDHETYQTWRALNPRALFSPEEAKGLEYDRVILAGFGHAWREVSQSQDTLKQRLFWARLYVALTRAREEIAIVEDPQDIAFWRKHFVYIPEEDLHKSKGFPKECVSPFLDEAQKAKDFGLKEESRLSLARNMYERAHRERNHRWFAEAAEYFENALNQEEVSADERLLVKEKQAISRFYAALLEGNPKGALEVLADGPFNFATRPSHSTLLRELTLEVWRREQWGLLQNVAKLHPHGPLRDFLQRVGAFMEAPSLEGAFRWLDELEHWKSIPLLSIKPYDDHRSEEVLWNVFRQWLRFLQHNLPSMSEAQKRHLAQRLSSSTLEDVLEEVLGQEGLRAQARLLFEIGREMENHTWLRRACNLWERTQATGSREYAYARALLSSDQPTEALVWWVKAGEYEEALKAYQALRSFLPPCRDAFWKNAESRNALVRLWQQYAPTWNLDELFHWLDCFWGASRQEALYLWKEARRRYPKERRRWHGWLKHRIERGIPYEAWRDIEASFKEEKALIKEFRPFFLQSVARYPQRLGRFLDALRRGELLLELEDEEWIRLLAMWGRALQEAERENRLLEWADLRNNPEIRELIQAQFEHHLLGWVELLQKEEGWTTSVWYLYEWLLGGRNPTQALWQMWTKAYQQAQKSSQRAFFLEQIYIRWRMWKALPREETCDFIEKVLTDLEQQRLAVQNDLSKKVAVLIENLCDAPKERSRHLQRLIPQVRDETLRNLLSKRAQQWLEPGEPGSYPQLWENVDQLQPPRRDTFPEALQDHLILMLHGRSSALQRVREWYQKASPQARQAMLEFLLREARHMRGVPAHVRDFLREIAQDPHLPKVLVNRLRQRFRLDR